MDESDTEEDIFLTDKDSKNIFIQQFLLCLMCLVVVAMEEPQEVLDFADSTHFNFRIKRAAKNLISYPRR